MDIIKDSKMAKKSKCKVCGDPTTTVFNIKLKAVSVCESCAASIFIQQASWYIKVTDLNINKEVE